MCWLGQVLVVLHLLIASFDIGHSWHATRVLLKGWSDFSCLMISFEKICVRSLWFDEMPSRKLKTNHLTCIVGINVWRFELIISFCSFFPNLRACEDMRGKQIWVSITVSRNQRWPCSGLFRDCWRRERIFCPLAAASESKQFDRQFDVCRVDGGDPLFVWLMWLNHQHQPERPPNSKQERLS